MVLCFSFVAEINFFIYFLDSPSLQSRFYRCEKIFGKVSCESHNVKRIKIFTSSFFFLVLKECRTFTECQNKNKNKFTSHDTVKPDLYEKTILSKTQFDKEHCCITAFKSVGSYAVKHIGTWIHKKILKP